MTCTIYADPGDPRAAGICDTCTCPRGWHDGEITPGDVITVGAGERCQLRVPLPNTHDKDTQCGREAGHDGQCAHVSLSGRVISVTGSPDDTGDPLGAYSPEIAELCAKIAAICEDAVSALQAAESEVWTLRSKYKGNENAELLIDRIKIPSDWDVEAPIDWSEPDEWREAVIENVEYEHRQQQRRAAAR